MSASVKQLKGRAARLARLMPSGSNSAAARTPFVLLVVLLLGGGLITLLLLNSSLNEGSFKLSEFKRQTIDLTDEQQALQRDVNDYSAPGALESRARELGMVPGGSPAFLNPDGTVHGVPGEAEGHPPVRQSAVTAAAPTTAGSPPRATGTPPATPTASDPGSEDLSVAFTASAGPAVRDSASAPADDPETSAQPSGNPAPTTSGR